MLVLQLEIEDLPQFRVREVLEAESVLNGEAASQSWVDVLLAESVEYFVGQATNDGLPGTCVPFPPCTQ